MKKAACGHGNYRGGVLLIGLIVLVLFGETPNKVMEESAEHRPAPSTPEESETAGKPQGGKARPEIPDHL
jgi:hypothetical protein